MGERVFGWLLSEWSRVVEWLGNGGYDLKITSMFPAMTMK